MKPVSLVLFEAFIVGILLLAIVLPVKLVIKKDYLAIVVSGIIFHLICEYTGINIWYSKEYCKLL